MVVTVPEDSGSIVCVDTSRPSDATFRLRPDNAAPFRQWFWFRCSEVAGVALRLRILDASSASFARAWDGYAAVASYDGVAWFRVPTRYVEGELRIEHTPDHDTVDYALFAPYTGERRRDRVARLLAGTGTAFRRVETLGHTPDGHPIEVLELGDGPLAVWILARQHPGEPMGEWFTEGLVDRLAAAGEDPVRDRIVAACTVRIVPCLNPDGVRRGNHRTTGLGVDLNRTWAEPDPVRAPEVARVRARMDETGVALALDVHGDEELPFVFASGGEGTPSWSESRAALKRRFVDAWIAANPDFQRKRGYPPAAPGEANLTVCAQQLNERYGGLALTIEQPFKDNADRPDPVAGWSPERSRALGASVLEPIAAVLPDLVARER